MRMKKVVLAVAAVITLLMILFPPVMKFQGENIIYEYQFILAIAEDYRFHGPLLLIQWFGLILITFLVLPFFDKNKGGKHKTEGDPGEQPPKH